MRGEDGQGALAELGRGGASVRPGQRKQAEPGVQVADYRDEGGLRQAKLCGGMGETGSTGNGEKGHKVAAGGALDKCGRIMISCQ